MGQREERRKEGTESVSSPFSFCCELILESWKGRRTGIVVGLGLEARLLGRETGGHAKQGASKANDEEGQTKRDESWRTRGERTGGAVSRRDRVSARRRRTSTVATSSRAKTSRDDERCISTRLDDVKDKGGPPGRCGGPNGTDTDNLHESCHKASHGRQIGER